MPGDEPTSATRSSGRVVEPLADRRRHRPDETERRRGPDRRSVRAVRGRRPDRRPRRGRGARRGPGRAQRDDADLRDRRVPLPAAGPGHRLVAVGPAAVAAAHPAHDRRRIGATDLSQRLPVRGHDDITALTRTVNGMLDRLESAFVSQKQFLDDAGHELRTPLTVLQRPPRAARQREPGRRSRRPAALLLDEVDRMARLTRDLILLAKSDRPDFLRTRARSTSTTSPRTWSRRPAASATGTGSHDGACPHGRGRHGPAADHPGRAAARRQRGQAHRRTATRSRSARSSTPAR